MTKPQARKKPSAVDELALLLDNRVKKRTVLLNNRVKKLEQDLSIVRERSAAYYAKMTLYQRDLAIYRSMARKGEIG